MNTKIKESVATLLAHIIKLDGRDIEKEAPLFCNILGQDFECSEAEGKALLENLMDKEYDLDHHIQIIKIALCEDKISKSHLKIMSSLINSKMSSSIVIKRFMLQYRKEFKGL